MKQRIKFIFTTWFIAISLFTINAQDVQTNKNDMENLNLTNEWDKTFPQSCLLYTSDAAANSRV